MKRSVFFVLLWLALVLLFAREPVLLRNSQHLAFDGVTVQLPNASTLVFWNDTSSGSADIYAQKLGSSGNSLWPSARQIVAHPQDQRIISAVYSSDGNVILLYMDFPLAEDGASLRLQKISLAGQCLWTAEGIHISDTDYAPRKDVLDLLANNVGGAFVLRHQSGVIAYNFNAAGINQWPESVVCTISNIYELQALSDGEGGLMINCSSHNSGDTNRVVHLDAAGDMIGNFDFSQPGLPFPNKFRMLKNTNGQYILYSVLANAVNMQIMDINGNLLLPEVMAIPNAIISAWPYDIRVIPASDGGVFLAYCGFADNHPSIAVHRLNSSLQELWTAPLISPISGSGSSYNLSLNSANSTWLIWDNGYNGYSDFSVNALRINADGSPAFSPIVIGTGNHYTETPLVFAQDDSACFVWNSIKEDRNGLTCQVLSNSGIPQLAADGRSIYSVLHGSTELSACKSLNDKFIYVYRDNRFFDIDKIYYQITDSDIVPLLEENGKALNPGSGDSENYLDCVSTANNKLLVLYAVYQGNTPELYLQEVDVNGLHTWPGQGLLITSSPGIDSNNSKLSLVNDDALVSWLEFSSGTNMILKGQRYHNGSPTWEAGGKTILNTGTAYCSLLKMHGNYIIYKYEDYSSGVYSIKALLIDDSGNPAPAWPASGIAITEPSTWMPQIYTHSGLMDDNLVCFIARFEDYVPCTVGQMLSPSGEKQWGENGQLIATDENSNIYLITDAAYDGNISCVGSFAIEQWFLHKISPSGELLFGQTGVTLDYAWSMSPPYSRLIRYANGSYSVLWSSYEAEYIYSLMHSYIGADGTVLDSAPHSIASNRTDYINLETAMRDNIGVLAYNAYSGYYLRGPDDIPMNSLWATRIDAHPTSIEDDYQPAPMLSCSNYPNPFNPETTIQFNLNAASPVRVEIYNLKGQLIKSLVNESKTSGLHKVIWNGSDNSGLSVSSGIYLYKIKAGQYSATRKMILMK